MVMISFLDESCEVRKATEKTTTSKGKVPGYEWTTHTTLRCKYDPRRRRSSESITQTGRVTIDRVTFFTAYNDTVTSDMIIIFDDETYRIEDVTKMRRYGVGHHLEIVAYKAENL